LDLVVGERGDLALKRQVVGLPTRCPPKEIRGLVVEPLVPQVVGQARENRERDVLLADAGKRLREDLVARRVLGRDLHQRGQLGDRASRFTDEQVCTGKLAQCADVSAVDAENLFGDRDEAGVVALLEQTSRRHDVGRGRFLVERLVFVRLRQSNQRRRVGRVELGRVVVELQRLGDATRSPVRLGGTRAHRNRCFAEMVEHRADRLDGEPSRSEAVRPKGDRDALLHAIGACIRLRHLRIDRGRLRQVAIASELIREHEAGSNAAGIARPSGSPTRTKIARCHDWSSRRGSDACLHPA